MITIDLAFDMLNDQEFRARHKEAVATHKDEMGREIVDTKKKLKNLKIKKK